MEDNYEVSEMTEETEAPVKVRKNRIARFISLVAVVCLLGYAVFSVISQQAEIATLKKQQEDLQLRITEQEQRNDEYTRLLSAGDEAEYMERIAVEQLGYAYPNERRFYIVEKSK